MPALRDLYEEIWIYGLPQICNPLEEIDLPASVHRKLVYTRYLRRNAPATLRNDANVPPFEESYLLVMTGGGGDGDALIDWVISAYEHDSDAPYPALIVFGPFMQAESQADFLRRVAGKSPTHAPRP